MQDNCLILDELMGTKQQDIEEQNTEMGPWIIRNISESVKEVEKNQSQKKKHLKNPASSLDRVSYKKKISKILQQNTQNPPLFPSISLPRQYTHELKPQESMTMTTVREQYGNVFQQFKNTSTRNSKMNEIFLQDQLRSHNFYHRRKKNRYLSGSQQHGKIMQRIEQLIKQEAPTFDIYERCTIRKMKKMKQKKKEKQKESFKFI